MRKAKMNKSELICGICGNSTSIFRNKGSRRNKYHIKDLYCIKCEKITKHIELGDLDFVKKELEFKENKNITEQLVYDIINHKFSFQPDVRVDNLKQLSKKSIKKGNTWKI